MATVNGGVDTVRDLRLLRALVEHAADLVSVIDQDGVLRFHYPPDLLGYEEGENLGRGIFEFIHPDDQASAKGRLAEALATPGVTEPFECRLRHADGCWRWFEIVGSNLVDDPVVQGLVINGRDVTDRKEAQDALRAREERYRALTQHASELMIVWDELGTITYASPATIRFARGPAATDLSTDVRHTTADVHPDDLHIVLSAVREIGRRPGATKRFVARYCRHDGVYRSLEVTVTNLLEHPGIRGVVASSHDITDQLALAEALRHSEQRWAALVQNSYDIVAVLDEVGTLRYASPATEGMLGFTPDSLVGVNAFDLVHPDDVEDAALALGEVLSHPDTPVRLELRIAHADGGWRWLEVAASNFLDHPAVGGLVLNNRDVTDRRHAESERRKSEEWFRSLVSNGYDIIVVTDAEGRVRYVSPSIVHVMGYRPEELVDVIGFDMVHPDDVPSLATHFSRAVASSAFQTPIEFRGRHADGTWRWLEVVQTNLLDNPAVNGVVLNFRDVSERKQAEEELAHQAVHDSLTDLPNRVLLVDRLEQALARAGRDETLVGVLFLDLDRFKLVNDTRGHAVGDELLRAVADRLRSATRAGDTVARFGGDEFAVVYERVTDDDDLLSRGRRLCETLAEPFVVEGKELYVTASFGAAVGRPDIPIEALLRDADAAMYHVKDLGGNAVGAVDEEIRRRVHVRFETEHALRGALERDELVLAFQPIAELDTGRVVAVEALVRWDHPQRGVILPGEFIGFAEESGLIVPIGAWVFERACRHVAEWRADPSGADLGLAVNLSVAQLRDAELPGMVRDTLARVGVDAGAVTLEITESFLMQDTVACLKTLSRLKDVGVRLALDDFGTRYASLGHINRMPLDALKIDQLFVHRLGGDDQVGAIVSAILAMADALGLEVVAEGVETLEQHRLLLELGCRLGQGFRLARPVPPEAVPAFLRDGVDV